jgi:hypothetical protein
MNILRVLKKAARDIYFGVLKYSGTTLIAESVDARLRKRRSGDHPTEPPPSQSTNADALSKR